MSTTPADRIWIEIRRSLLVAPEQVSSGERCARTCVVIRGRVLPPASFVPVTPPYVTQPLAVLFGGQSRRGAYGPLILAEELAEGCLDRGQVAA